MGHYANDWDDPEYWEEMEHQEDERRWREHQEEEAWREGQYWDGVFRQGIADLTRTLKTRIEAITP